MNLSLSEDVLKLIDQRVRSGQYATAKMSSLPLQHGAARAVRRRCAGSLMPCSRKASEASSRKERSMVMRLFADGENAAPNNRAMGNEISDLTPRGQRY